MVKPAALILLHKTNVGIAVFAKCRPTKKQLYQAARVTPGSYAAELVERFHEFFIGRACDVRAEYKRYYAEEYGSLGEFLYKKRGMDARSLSAMKGPARSMEFVGVVQESWGRDWQMQSLLENCPNEFEFVMAAVHAVWVEGGA